MSAPDDPLLAEAPALATLPRDEFSSKPRAPAAARDGWPTRMRTVSARHLGLWQHAVMGSRGKLPSTVGVALATVFALTGCVAPGSGYAVLERDAEPADTLPADLPAYALDDVEPASSRSVGEHDGNALYLANAKERERVCLLVYANASDWVIGCGGEPEFAVGGPNGNYVVRPDSAPEPDRMVEVAPNVFASAD
ncbi:hypothetical protein [Agromyces larvae]|uniref:Secreted protein n=1 Tax=Agromyces larvae TaxID=2929802 RepID=A0ABY4BW64_9MICO|nr:hypothetical protein [Agromyces larvae]UOE43467.1 hypothetical protein MTO99_14995 [Agromyces larvae]